MSWIHVDDFLASLRFVCEDPTFEGIVHVTSPNPVRNRDMMRALRTAFGRPWSPPTPEALVRFGAVLLRTDPALALTGRRCVPRRLLDAGAVFAFPTFDEAVRDLAGGAGGRRPGGGRDRS